MQAALEIASLFLEPDQLVFSVKGRRAKTEEVRVPKLARPYKFPVADADQREERQRFGDSGRRVAGSRSRHHSRRTQLRQRHGAERVYTLSSNTGLALTIAFYYTPSGRSIQKPLAFGQLDSTAIVPLGSFHTDAGREVRGGGGIQPDETVQPAAAKPPRNRAGRQRFASPASPANTCRPTRSIPDFEVTPELLDELRVFLSARRIQPGVGDLLQRARPGSRAA